jgi:hypothetical protein
MLDPMVPERRPILRLLMPDENSYSEAGLSQRVMLNAAGRRRGERRDRERENYASSGTLFHNRISPWDVTPGQTQGSAVNQ